MQRGNLFATTGGRSGAERVETLLEQPGWKLERIVSMGQSTPPGQWLEQDRDEWVLLLSGSAELRFEQDAARLSLRPGDWVAIPGGMRHRVERTDPDAETVWLALHFES